MLVRANSLIIQDLLVRKEAKVSSMISRILQISQPVINRILSYLRCQAKTTSENIVRCLDTILFIPL
jgi:hypothetical protein